MFNIFKKKVWPPSKRNPPWRSTLSIYTHIATHIDPEKPTGLSEEGYRLPDEQPRDPNRISFAPGAMDGIMSRHGSSKSGEQAVLQLYETLRRATENASDSNITALYSHLKDGHVIGVIDDLAEKIWLEKSLDADRLYEIAHWFATQATDREPVKFSIALLGLLRGHDDSEILLTLGRHDEFTLYAAAAIAGNEGYSDKVLWKLAKAAEGWGKIGTVERLAKTTDPEIKDWLIREGFKNNVMYEYLACICARSGDLHLALQADRIDDDLFNSAVDIVETLLDGEGGPTEGLSDYEHGCAAVAALLKHGTDKFDSASHYSFLSKLKDRLDAHQSGDEKLAQDWSADKVDLMSTKLADLLVKGKWHTIIHEALQSGNGQQFWSASRDCREFGIDPWPYFYRRTEAGEDYWWDLMRTSDADRIDRVLDLGLKKIPLDEIATGPGNELGLGPEYSSHSALGFILQDLGKFPGKGWAFIAAGLLSPVVRNRNMSIRALSEWDQKDWPQETVATLTLLCEAEIDDDIRLRLQALLEGTALH
ncbi:hypothetical protein [Rhizobium sp. RM]|uniref:hypothetical protein n=1 Tax=Rhizobium sp. RM TaxID=2748079 RepID=UPI00110D79BF|nr:hypothetical protein [Rhizobium sp. RM]NWJ25945.1 hypothetical protein [Rhizobium sp. RM]TMV15777.1 hypothetical protein BJG94_21835 [Rhizobium sp. Td3]